jgi:hypothetical protein
MSTMNANKPSMTAGDASYAENIENKPTRRNHVRVPLLTVFAVPPVRAADAMEPASSFQNIHKRKMIRYGFLYMLS